MSTFLVHAGTLSAFACKSDKCDTDYLDPTMTYATVLVDEFGMGTEAAMLAAFLAVRRGGTRRGYI